MNFTEFRVEFRLKSAAAWNCMEFTDLARKKTFHGIGKIFHFLSAEFPFLNMEFPFPERRISIF